MRRTTRASALLAVGVGLMLATAGTTTATTPATTPPGTAAPSGDLCADKAKNSSNIKAIEAVDASTVKFTLCAPDVAFPAKVAFSAFQIAPSEYLTSTGGTGDLLEKPIGTGPYKLSAWEKGSQIVLERNDDYWGTKALSKTVVFKWNGEGAQRLVELQSGNADGIDNLGTDDFAAVEGDANLQIKPRDALNVFYVGFNVDMTPFDKPEVRKAIALTLDRQRLVDNFYPKGSVAATQFLPPGIPGFDKGFTDFTKNVTAQLLDIGVTIEQDSLEYGAYLEKARLAKTDPEGAGWQINEHTCTGIELPPPSDLKVEDVQFGGSAKAGDPISITWTVVNDSDNPTSSSWTSRCRDSRASRSSARSAAARSRRICP